MTALPWMQIYIGDELAETAALSPEEYGCHMRLRLHQWLHGGLPTDEERLRRICSAEREHWPSIRDALAPLFDWQWHHPRTAELRRQSEELRQTKVENGKKGGRPRKQHENQNETETKPTGKANWKADENLNESTSPSPSPSESQSRSQSASASPDSAPENGRGDTDTREGYLQRFPIPPSEAAGRKLLRDRGVPEDEMNRLLAMLMAGHLTRYDIEEWDTKGAAA